MIQSESKEGTLSNCSMYLISALQPPLLVINILRSFFRVHLFFSSCTFLQLPSLLFVLYYVSLFLFVSSRSLHYFSCRSGPPKVKYTLQRFLGHLTFNKDD